MLLTTAESVQIILKLFTLKISNFENFLMMF